MEKITATPRPRNKPLIKRCFRPQPATRLVSPVRTTPASRPTSNLRQPALPGAKLAMRGRATIRVTRPRAGSTSRPVSGQRLNGTAREVRPCVAAATARVLFNKTIVADEPHCKISGKRCSVLLRVVLSPRCPVFFLRIKNRTARQRSGTQSKQ